MIDNPTWTALLKFTPDPAAWMRVRRASAASVSEPPSASLPALAHEIVRTDRPH